MNEVTKLKIFTGLKKDGFVKSRLQTAEHAEHAEKKFLLLGSYLCDLCALSGDFLFFKSLSKKG